MGGDRHDPPAEDTRHPAEDAAQGREHQRQQPAEQPEHGGRCHRGRHHDVRDDGHEADLAREGRDHRRAHQLGGEWDGDRLRGPPGHPDPELVAEHRRQEQDAGRRQHRQHEAERQRQPGVDQQQRQRGHAERPDPLAPAVDAHPDQGHRAHRGGADDTRLGAGHEHEPDDTQRAHHQQSAGPDPGPPGQHQQRTDDEREVRAGHRRQVGQSAGPEVLDNRRRHLPVVPDDQSRDQRARLRTAARQRAPDPRPDRLRPIEHLTGGRDDHGGAAGRQHRRRRQVIGGSQPAGPLDRLAERQRGPGLVPDHQHARRGGEVAPAAADLRDVQPDQHERAEAPLPLQGVRGDPGRERDHGALLGQPRDRAAAGRLEPHQGARADRGSRQHAAGEDPGRPAPPGQEQDDQPSSEHRATDPARRQERQQSPAPARGAEQHHPQIRPVRLTCGCRVSLSVSCVRPGQHEVTR